VAELRDVAAGDFLRRRAALALDDQRGAVADPEIIRPIAAVALGALCSEAKMAKI
jgi:hypothetical protein